MNSLYLHLLDTPIWSFTIFILLVNIPICFSNDLEWYDSCGNYFTCGNVTKVGFPFWGGGSRPKKCGYSEFELTCDSNVTTKMEIAGMKYQVLDINQNTKILSIARDDFMQGPCLQKFVNTTLDFELLGYAPGIKNMTVFYGCPPLPSYGDGYGSPSTSSTPGQFTCRVNGANSTLCYPELGAVGPSGCYASVVVPVLGSLAPQIGVTSLDQILAQGFKAKYKEVDEVFCVKCEASRGRCGVDPSTNKTSCVCPDGSAGSSLCSIASAPAPSKSHCHRDIR